MTASVHPADQETDDEKEKKAKRARIGACCKKTLKFLCSHLGMSIMVVGYSVAGGLIFEHLEKPNEKTECTKAQEKYYPAENNTISKLWEISNTRSGDREYVMEGYERVLQKFREDVLDLGYDGEDCDLMGQTGGPGYKWSFAASLLFSVTVTTTIGYGNIAPKTFWGRLVLIAYAVLGIPLMLIYLANIGDVMADIFRFVYSKICCCGCCRRKEYLEKEDVSDEKDEDPADDWKTQFTKGLPPPKAEPEVIEDDEEEEEEEAEVKVNVPLTVNIMVITCYIVFGAMLFGLWEKWDLVKASYFCFVTVTTIGFGDVVPGSASFEKEADQYMMILSSIYMILGMAIISMCFSLMQEEISSKFVWIGAKMGIIEKQKDEDGEDEEPEEEEELVVSKSKTGSDKAAMLTPLPPVPVSKSRNLTVLHTPNLTRSSHGSLRSSNSHHPERQSSMKKW